MIKGLIKQPIISAIQRGIIREYKNFKRRVNIIEFLNQGKKVVDSIRSVGIMLQYTDQYYY